MVSDPLWVNASGGAPAFSAHELRVADALLAMTDGTGRGARGGMRPGSGLSLSVSGTTITVSTGSAFVPGPTGEGIYRVGVDSTWTQTYNPADATWTRIDLVYLRVWDTDLDGTGLRQADIVYLAGTPSGTPAAPVVPAGQYAVQLGTVTVPASGGGAATSSMAVRQLTVAPGGILPNQTTNPPGTYTGMYWDDGTDLKRYNGTGTDTMAKVITTPWITAPLDTGWAHDGNSNGFVQYRLVTSQGTPMVEWCGGIGVTYNGDRTMPHGGILLSSALPVQYRPASARSLPAVCSQVTSALTCLIINFQVDGTVTLAGPTTATSDSYATPVVRPPWFSLNGVRYRLS